MSYDPKFPYRINGDPVNADSVGVAIRRPKGVMEVECKNLGLVIEMDGEVAILHPHELEEWFHRQINEQHAKSDENARRLLRAEQMIDEAEDEPDPARRAAMVLNAYRSIKDIDIPHADRIKNRAAHVAFDIEEEQE